MPVPPSPTFASFGPFQLDIRAGELHRDGQVVRLQEQPLQVLRMLLDQPREVVSREEIRRRLWPNDTVVEFDQSINAAIKKLRLALVDSADNPHYVETVARRGYRLMGSSRLVEVALASFSERVKRTIASSGIPCCLNCLTASSAPFGEENTPIAVSKLPPAWA